MLEPYIVYPILFVLGIVIGSFLNVCIYRIPRNESISRSRSHCTFCDAQIKDYDLIPVVSYLILGGRCRNCKERISPRYITVELLCAVIWMFIYFVSGFTLDTLFFCIMAAVLIAIAFIDFEHMIIPDGLIIFLLIVGIIFNILKLDISFTISSVIGFFAASVPLYIMAWITKGGMGGGDIKLMAVCGLFIGWANILIALFLGAIIACLYVIFMKLIKKWGEENIVVFGPFLSVGILLSALFGNIIVSSYLQLF